MAIIWNQDSVPAFFPIDSPEELEAWVEASMDDMEAILQEAEEDEDAPAIVEEEEQTFTGGKGFG